MLVMFISYHPMLHKASQKINSAKRLTIYLDKVITEKTLKPCLNTIRRWVPSEPRIHIDDSAIIKQDGYKFEALRLVRNGSRSKNTKNVYKKGYHVTEAGVLTTDNHLVSIFSQIHSSKDKNFTFINNITFSTMERAAALLAKITFVMDKGYDNNKMFLKLDELKQDYIIRQHSFETSGRVK